MKTDFFKRFFLGLAIGVVAQWFKLQPVMLPSYVGDDSNPSCPDNGLGKAAEDGPSARTPAHTGRGSLDEVPGFGLACPWQLWSSGE